MSEMSERLADRIVRTVGPAIDPRVAEMAARAAIEAMREPSQEQLSQACYQAEKAGLTGIDFDNPPMWIRHLWQAMIDEALR